MKELQRKQKVRRVMYSIPFLIMLADTSFLLVRGAWRVMEKEQESKARAKELTEKANALTLREQELKRDLSRLKTEEGIKSEIRERFNVTQEGEQVAIIVDDKGVSSSTDQSLQPWYKKVWSAIMGNK